MKADKLWLEIGVVLAAVTTVGFVYVAFVLDDAPFTVKLAGAIGTIVAALIAGGAMYWRRHGRDAAPWFRRAKGPMTIGLGVILASCILFSGAWAAPVIAREVPEILGGAFSRNAPSAPTIVLALPTSAVQGSGIKIEGEVRGLRESDAILVAWSFNDAAPAAAAVDRHRFVIEFDSTLRENGINAGKVSVSLNGGDPIEQTFVVVVRNDRPPLVSIDPVPRAAEGIVVVSGNATDPDGGAVFARWRIDDGEDRSLTIIRGRWQLELDTRLWPDGPHTLTVSASDPSHANVSARRRIDFQNNHAPQVMIDSPADEAIVNGRVTFAGRLVDDAPPHESSLRWSVDGGILAAADLIGNAWTVAWDSRSVSDGRHTFQIVAIDRNEAKDSASLEVIVANRVLNEPPMIEVSFPREGALVTELTPARGTAYDPDGDTLTVMIRLDELSSEAALGISPWQSPWNLGSLGPGQHRLTVTADDGRSRATAVVNFTIAPRPSTPSPSSSTITAAGPSSTPPPVESTIPTLALASSEPRVGPLEFVLRTVTGPIEGSDVEARPLLPVPQVALGGPFLRNSTDERGRTTIVLNVPGAYSAAASTRGSDPAPIYFRLADATGESFPYYFTEPDVPAARVNETHAVTTTLARTVAGRSEDLVLLKIDGAIVDSERVLLTGDDPVEVELSWRPAQAANVTLSLGLERADVHYERTLAVTFGLSFGSPGPGIAAVAGALLAAAAARMAIDPRRR